MVGTWSAQDLLFNLLFRESYSEPPILSFLFWDS
jgi:hypothetical protein